MRMSYLNDRTDNEARTTYLISRYKSVNSLLWSKYCGITTSAKLSGFLTTNISPSSDHEQIDESHVSIILASFLRKIGTVLNELSFSKSLAFVRCFFWPPLFNGADDGDRFDIVYRKIRDEVECEEHGSAEINYVSFLRSEKNEVIDKKSKNCELLTAHLISFLNLGLLLVTLPFTLEFE